MEKEERSFSSKNGRGSKPSGKFGPGDNRNSNHKGSKPGRSEKPQKDDSHKDERQSGGKSNMGGKGVAVNTKPNDYSWIASSATSVMREAAGKLPFGIPTGTPFNLGNVANSTPYVIPGIMGIHGLFTVGVATDEKSPINIATQMLYAWLKKSNSRTGGYTRSDLGIYIAATTQLYAYLGWLVRIVGLINKWDVLNKYTPASICDVDGIDYKDLVANQAKLRFFAASYAARCNAFAIPGNLPIYANALYQFSHIFLDGDISKSQIYMFCPVGFGQYQSTAEETGSSVKYDIAYSWTGTLHGRYKVNDIISLGEGLLDSMLEDSMIGTISAEIIRAYTVEGLTTIPSIDFNNIEIQFEKSPEILLQIHNLRAFPLGEGTTYNYIQRIPTNPDVAPYLLSSYEEVVQGLAEGIPSRNIIDLFSAAPSVEEVHMATRLHPCFTVTQAGDSGEVNLSLISSDAFLPIGITCNTLVDASTGSMNRVHFKSHISEVLEVEQWAINVPVFDWAPLVTYYYEIDEGDRQYNNTVVLGDVQNMGVFDNDLLTPLHTASIYSLLNVPLF